MLKFVRITFALIALALSIYGFITDNRGILLYMFIVLGLMSFTMSIEELRRTKESKWNALFSSWSCRFIHRHIGISPLI